jgi:hypothetical protein
VSQRVLVGLALVSFASALAFTQIPTESEPNNTPATANAAVQGGRVTGRVDPHDSDADTADYWVLVVNAGDTIQIDVDHLPQCYDSYIGLTLFAGDGSTQLAIGQNWDGCDPLLTYVAPTSGRYYARITTNRYSGMQTPYTLNFFKLSCPGDVTEPNGTLAAAPTIAIPSQTEGRWCPSGDNDFFRFTVDSGARLEFQLNDFHHPGYDDSRLMLLDRDSTPLVWSFDGQPLRYEFGSGGDYYIWPTAQGGLAFHYRIGVRVPPPAALTTNRAARALLRVTALDSSEMAYLDSIGNGNRRFDAGDYRAFLLQEERARQP